LVLVLISPVSISPVSISPVAAFAAVVSPALPLALPATFQGTTRCADCAGIDVTLTLRADGTFAQRYVYQGRPSTFTEGGAWTYEADSETLALKAAGAGPAYVRVLSGTALEPLDANGDPLTGGVSSLLIRAPHVISLTAPKATKAPGLMLDSNSWSILELDGEKITVPADAKSPALAFDATTKRVSGSTGCNSIAGSYEEEGSALKFSPLATTRMACPPPFAAVETRFLKALEQTTSFRIEGATLELRNGTTVLASFKANR